MRHQLKHTFITVVPVVLMFVILLMHVNNAILYTCTDLKRTQECLVPMYKMRMCKTPLKFHEITCSAKESDKLLQSDMVLPNSDKTISRYVIHKPIGGRIGNLMFQTASTFGIAATLGYKTYIDESHPLLQYFEMSPSTRMNLTNKVVLTEEECMDSAWRCRKEIYSHNVTVQGWLQSWKYFHHIASTIRKQFTFKSLHKEPARKFLDSSRFKSRTVIGIHVRRGDFGNDYFTQCGYAMASPVYFQTAMEMFRAEFNNAIFVVVSDSIEWCKKNIIANDIIYSELDDPINDMALMSMCDHMIVSGGTFGFWGAWLAGGKVIYPKDWPRPDSWLDLYGMIIDDFWVPDWVGINSSVTTSSWSTLSIILVFLGCSL